MSTLMLFSKEGPELQEFVVITEEEPDEVRGEYEEGGFSLVSTAEIVGNVTSFPTDRSLSEG